MSYTPGTKLSHSEEKATVITQGYLMPTQGKYTGQRMLVADWIILADGATIYEDYIPLGREAVELEAVAPEALAPEALAPEALAPEPLRSEPLRSEALAPLPSSQTSSIETEGCCETEFLPVSTPSTPLPPPTPVMPLPPPPTKPRPPYNNFNWPSPVPALLVKSLGIVAYRTTHERALEMLASRFNCSVEAFLQTNWTQLNLNYRSAGLMRKCGKNRYRY
jgi:hypothetical protein